jgi:SOS-response transcriptional repressor LexA
MPDAAAGGFDAEHGACGAGEAFALRVIGNDMAPEFEDGHILIIEPDGALRDGSYVLARLAEDEWIFRQLVKHGEGWALRALNPACQDQPWLPLCDLSTIHGVVIQRAVPGRRRLSKFYV